MSISVNSYVGIANQIDIYTDKNFISILQIDMSFISMSISVSIPIGIATQIGIAIDMNFIRGVGQGTSLMSDCKWCRTVNSSDSLLEINKNGRKTDQIVWMIVKLLQKTLRKTFSLCKSYIFKRLWVYCKICIGSLFCRTQKQNCRTQNCFGRPITLSCPTRLNFISIHKIDMKSISMAISILFKILIGISFGMKIDMTFISI